MAEILVGLLGPAIELGKCIAAPIKRHFNYLCCFNSNIQTLRDQAAKLDQEKTTLQCQVDEANDNARKIASAVKTWMDETNDIQAEMTKIESAIPNVPKGCLSLIHRFPLSKRAKMAAETMKDLCGRRSHIDPIFLPRDALAGQLLISSEQPFKLQSRNQIEEEVMNALRDQHVNMVGICGMGGIGKTTLAKKLIMPRVKKENLFDETVFVVVSQPADTSKIQVEIAEQLRCNDVKKTDSLEVRKNILSARLSGTKRVLVILDDIWEQLKLGDLGIPCGKDSKGCTVLVTSRALDVLSQMNVKVVPMGILLPGEAWSLFKDKAGICEDDRNLLTIAEEVANECKGLPVSIVAIGSALKGQELRSWKDVLDRLKSSNPSNMPPYIEKEVYIPLRVSYDFLEDRDANSLFLLCCIFPEDFEIEVEDLALYSMGLKMFGGISNVEQARNRVFTVVKKLKSRFLLLDGDDEKHVKMHDVIREVAISIAKEKGLVGDSDRDSKWLYHDITGSESFGHRVESKFPSLQLLIIYGGIWRYRNPFADTYDFTLLEGLKVLSFNHISLKSVPQSIGLLKDLRTLQLVRCELNTLSFVGELSRLEVFQCTYCYQIGELPLEFGRLNCLKFIDLSHSMRLQKIPSGVISSLVELEELKMVGSFSGWESTKVKDEESRNCSLKELEPLRKLTCLQIQIQDTNLIQENIILPPNIEKYIICIGVSFGGIGEEKNLEKVMVLHRIPGESSFGNWIHKLANTAEYLDLDGDGSGKLDLSQSHNSLKVLKIANCGMLKELVDTSSSSISINSGESGVFPMLKNLKLENLPDLKQICGGPNQQVSLRNLCKVRIVKCPMLPHLFTLERAKGVLLQLKSLKVKDCEMIEQVFILNEEIGFGIESIEFASLEKLEVRECKQLKRLVFGEWESWHGHDDLIGSGEYEECPHLFCNTKIKLCGLKDVTLRYDDVSNLWCRLIPMCFFRRLESLQIDNCHNIRSLFTSEMAENLVNLYYLVIKECDRMEQVFFFLKKEENDRKTSGITFPKLVIFQLGSLPSLTSLGKGFESIEFPQLKSLRIEHCPKLTSMVPVMENNGKCDDEEFMPLFCHKKVKVCGLEELYILNCHNITSVFTSSMVEILVNLHHLRIEECDAMEEVLRNEKNKDEAKTSQIAFLKLKTLALLGLPSLITMGKGIGNIEFPMLYQLNIKSCPKLKSMVSPTECNEESAEGCNNDDEPFHILFTGKVKFSKLERLDVKGCHEIVGLLSSSAATNLTSLKWLKIEECEHMKKVITGVAKEMNANSLFPSLKYFKIENMPSLEKFCEWEDAFKLPVARSTQFFGCPQVKYPQVSAAPSHSKLIKTLKLPDLPMPSNVERLLYMNSGVALVALDSNTVRHLWTWPHNDQNPSGKSSTSIVPHCYAHHSAYIPYDFVKLLKDEDYVACIALSKDDSYVISNLGKPEISRLNMKTFTVYENAIFPNNITYLALHPQDDGDVLAVGNEDSTIDIRKLGGEPLDRGLKGGHQKRISGLAFSQSLNILVSSGADAHLCIWSIDDRWEKKKSCLLQAPPGHLTPLDGETRVQFRIDQSHLLVVHQTQIAIYDAQLECLRLWYPINSLPSPVSCATFSCDGQRIFTGFRDGAVGVFGFECLTLQCRISPSEYIPSDIPSSSNGFPIVIDIAAHPFDQNQFALTNGELYVIELDDNAEIKSEALTPQVNDGLPSITSSSTINRQKPETPPG